MIGLYNMSDLGLRSFSGITLGVGGSLVSVHWSLGASAIVLLAVTIALSLFAIRFLRNTPAPGE